MFLTLTALLALFPAAEEPTVPTPSLAQQPLVVVQEGRPTLGVSLSIGDRLEIIEVTAGSAAEAAGLRVGDGILAVAGRSLEGVADPFELLLGEIEAAGVGGPLALTIQRGDTQLAIATVVGDQDGAVETAVAAQAEARPAFLGVEILDGEAGAMVGRVIEGTAADRAGLLSGDEIVMFGGADIPDGDGLVSALGDFAAGEVVAAVVWRDGNELEFQIELGAREAAAMLGEPRGGMAMTSDGEIVEREIVEQEIARLMEAVDMSAEDFDVEAFEAELEALMSELDGELEIEIAMGVPLEWEADFGQEWDGEEWSESDIEALELGLEGFDMEMEEVFEGFEYQLEEVFGRLEEGLVRDFERFEREFENSVEDLADELEMAAQEMAYVVVTEVAPMVQELSASTTAGSGGGASRAEMIELRAELDVVRAERDAANARVDQLEAEIAAMRGEVRELIRLVEALER